MGEKLLEINKNASIESIIEKINIIVKEKFSILDQKDDIEKWNSIPKLLLLDDKVQQRILQFTEFMDSLFMSVEEKAMIIVSLSGLIEFADINLNDFDDGSLYTLADYYKDSNKIDIERSILLFKNNDLLLAVRKKTLDLETRTMIMKKIEEDFKKARISMDNIERKNDFIAKKINELETKEYFELV